MWGEISAFALEEISPPNDVAPAAIHVLIAAGNRRNPRAHHVRQRVGDAQRIAMIRKATRQTIGKAKMAIGYRQQHCAAVGTGASAIECACDFLAGKGWRRQQGETIVGRAGRVW